MKILFEGHKYKSNSLAPILPGTYFKTHDDKDCPTHVGYFFSKQIGESVFILPKVFLDAREHFMGIVYPEDLFSLTFTDLNRKYKHRYDQILSSLAIFIYQAIYKYKEQSEGSMSDDAEVPIVFSNHHRKKHESLLEIYISIISFYEKHKNLITYISKISHTGRKIKWAKTIASKQPIIVDNIPIYLAAIASRNKINYNEILIILLYSVLNYFKNIFGFNFEYNLNYELIKGNSFRRLLDGKGALYLKSIKNKYFRDEFIQLWELLYAFFDLSKRIENSENYEDILMCSNFNLLFEEMVDSLICDDTDHIPRYYSDQKDGKRVDHLFSYLDLLNDKKIFYIGDSKYYMPDATIKGESLEKQYTYAKNIIDYNIRDLIRHKEAKSKRYDVWYRDNLTEGYNITPNFFILGVVIPPRISDHLISNLDFLHPNLQFKDIQEHRQFENRLFDRDTLVVLTYEINFLFVLTSYISRCEISKTKFRRQVRDDIRKRNIDILNSKYLFYEFIFDDTNQRSEFIKANFKSLIGKVYIKYQSARGLVLALENLEKFSIENNEVLNLFRGIKKFSDADSFRIRL